MNRTRSLVLIAAAAAILIALPQAALAAGPETSPAVIHAEGFESATMPGLTLAPDVSAAFVRPAFWGRVTQRHYAGSYGLWAAGSVTATPSLDAWTTWEGMCPLGMEGFATLDVPQLDQYYSSTVEYRYTMPTLGSIEYDAFRVLWWPTADGTLKDYDHVALATSAGEWRPVTLDLTAPGNRFDLSRTAGTVRFQFSDNHDPLGLSGGEGPTIDDLYVRGFKFGPVRGLGATLVGGGVHLAWQTPARSTAVGAPVEERPVAYRVYRSPDASPAVWTELTASRTALTAFDDPAPPNGYVRYAVQAWDPGAGNGYGQISLPADSVRVGVGPDLPPTTEADLTPGAADGLNGWYRTVFPAVSIARDLAGTTYARWDTTPTWSTSTASSMDLAHPTDGLGSVYQGTVTLHYYGVSTLGTTEAEHTSVVRFDSVQPVGSFVVNGGATSTVAPAVSIDSTLTDGVSGPGYMAISTDGGASYEATRAFSPHIAFTLADGPGTYTLRVRFWDLAGNEDPAVHERVVTLVSDVPTTVTIRTTATSARIGQIPILSGAATPDTLVGKLMVVYVQKPGSARWTYSSNRIVYSLAGHAAWQYKYYFKRGMTKGTYKFKAVVPPQAGFRTSTSPTTVSIRLS